MCNQIRARHFLMKTEVYCPQCRSMFSNRKQSLNSAIYTCDPYKNQHHLLNIDINKIIENMRKVLLEYFYSGISFFNVLPFAAIINKLICSINFLFKVSNINYILRHYVALFPSFCFLLFLGSNPIFLNLRIADEDSFVLVIKKIELQNL